MKLREKLQQAMDGAKETLPRIAKEYSHHFGLPYRGGMVETYQCEDAEIAILALGGLASEAKDAVDGLRMKGHRVGLIRVRVFRPFPANEIRKIAKTVRTIVVFDRDVSAGMEGILFTEVKSALFGELSKLEVAGFIVGLGGVDVTSVQIAGLVKKCIKEKIQGGSIWYQG